MSKHIRALLAVILLLPILAACTPAPTPEVVTKEVEKVVTKEVEKVVTQEVEKVVTKEVEVEKVVTATPAAAAEAPAATFERGETLYTSGTQWGPPSNWNPFMQGNYAMGTFGLCYESLFLYDPLADKYTPWLAESGKWLDKNTYELKIRQGINWSDGKPLTADDVKFTFELSQKAALYFSSLWDWLASIDKVDDYTLQFKFKDTLYQEWAYFLYNVPIVPQHIWGTKDANEIATGANDNPVGTGAYLFESYDQSRMVWVKNDNWWAIKALNLNVAPKHIVDIVNGSNNVALGLVLQGGLDLSNNFLPGVATLVKGGYGIQTYYPDAPFMLSANTAWLDLNLQKKPMDDVAFRKALAYAINVQEIVNTAYANLVQPADPTGLLPVWDKYIDKDVVKELGWTYDPEKAKAILAEAGYKDVDNDKFVEAPDGSKIALKIIVPNGWTDWMESIKIISKGAQAVGINIQPDYPDFNGYLAARLDGTFDLCIDNQPQISNTPWTHYRWVFYNPLKDIASSQGGNYGRYDNQKAFDLVTQLDKTPVDDAQGMLAITSQIQRIQLTDMPIIPLWYNGAWAQYSNAVWTNWPSAADKDNHYLPVTWRGYWNLSAIQMLTQIKPVPAQ